MHAAGSGVIGQLSIQDVECKVNQLWGVEGSIILLNYDAKWLQEVLKLEFHESVFKKGKSAIPFDEPFHKNGLVLGSWNHQD